MSEDERLPFCPCCGTPCEKCRGEIDEYTLGILEDEARPMVLDVLSDIGKTKENLIIMVKGLFPFKTKHIARAYRVWKSGGYAKRGITHPSYFVKMVQSGAISKEPKLEALPPLKEL